MHRLPGGRLSGAWLAALLAAPALLAADSSDAPPATSPPPRATLTLLRGTPTPVNAPSRAQAATAVATRLEHRYKDDLVGIVTLEALQDICHNRELWMQTYGILPTMKNYNVFNGTGIALPAGAAFDADVMMSSQHSGSTAHKVRSARRGAAGGRGGRGGRAPPAASCCHSSTCRSRLLA